MENIHVMKASILLACFVATSAADVSASSGSSSSSNGQRQTWPFIKPATFRHCTLQTALARPYPEAAVLILATSRPQRRTSNQPVLVLSPQLASQVPLSLQHLLTELLHQFEQLRGTIGFRWQLGVLPSRTTGHVPLAVFDASTGTLLLGPTPLKALSSTPLHAFEAVMQAALSAGEHVLSSLGSDITPSLAQLLLLAPRAAAAGVAVAFLAAVPRWFCFVCPIVLGLLAPLVINAGVGEAASLACEAMSLPDDECVELWFAALGLGMVLSLLSAIPIYKVCKLYECAHPHFNDTAAVLAVQ